MQYVKYNVNLQHISVTDKKQVICTNVGHTYVLTFVYEFRSLLIDLITYDD